MSELIELDTVEVFASGLPHPEGVVFDRDGNCYTGISYSDHESGGPVMRITPDGSNAEELANTGGRILGIAIGSDGDLYGCDGKLGAVFRISSDGRVSSFLDSVPRWSLMMPNFGVFDSDGTFYVSDSGTATAGEKSGAILRVSRSGRAEVLVDGLIFANGLALDEDQGALYVVETRDDRVLRVDLESAQANTDVYAENLSSGPDGLALDSEGVLWATATRGSRLYAISDRENVRMGVEDAEDRLLHMPSNLAFSPDGSPVAYVANLFGQHISRVPMPASGRPLAHLH